MPLSPEDLAAACLEAKDPSTTISRLVTLRLLAIDHPDNSAELLKLLAVNPNVPGGIYDELLWMYPLEAIDNPGFALYLLEDPDLVQRQVQKYISLQTFVRFITHPEFTRKLLGPPERIFTFRALRLRAQYEAKRIQRSAHHNTLPGIFVNQWPASLTQYRYGLWGMSFDTHAGLELRGEHLSFREGKNLCSWLTSTLKSNDWASKTLNLTKVSDIETIAALADTEETPIAHANEKESPAKETNPENSLAW